MYGVRSSDVGCVLTIGGEYCPSSVATVHIYKGFDRHVRISMHGSMLTRPRSRVSCGRGCYRCYRGYRGYSLCLLLLLLIGVQYQYRPFFAANRTYTPNSEDARSCCSVRVFLFYRYAAVLSLFAGFLLCFSYSTSITDNTTYSTALAGIEVAPPYCQIPVV